MREFTAQDLRDIIEAALVPTIGIHRGSRMSTEGASYSAPTGPPTDEEIDDFIAVNPLLDEETQEQLMDPGLLGFRTKTARASDEWLSEFRESVESWAENNAWLAADLPWRNVIFAPQPIESNIWLPGHPRPGWLPTAPAALLLATDFLRSGRALEELSWRKFEEVIGALLEASGWKVTVTRPAKDGGFDVVAIKDDDILGPVKSLWQAKKYNNKRAVRLHEVRELASVIDIERATKGVIVTTSRLTKDAISWIKRDSYRLDYKDANRVESWIRTVISKTK